MPEAPVLSTAPPAQRRRVAFSGFVGTTIEYFDFLLYGLIAPVVFERLFFPNSSSFAATISVLGSYAVGYAARPLGGVVFGHFGDRTGRKPMMFASLITMGLATTLTGLLPSYAAIGAWAPVLLVVLRFAQGFALGGETVGANILMTENAPTGRRGLFNGYVQVGAALGSVLASLAAALVTRMDAPAMLAWGWRVPFLCSAVLLLVGVYVRLRIDESAVFTRVVAERRTERVPLLTALRREPRACLTVFCIVITETSMLNVFTVFILTFGPAELGASPAAILDGVLIGNVVGIAANPLFGRLSDRVGRRPLIAASLVIAALYTPLFFPMVASGDTALVVLAVALPPALIQTMLFGVEGSFYPELFRSARLRFSGLGLSRQLAGALGGLFPVAATAVFAVTGGTWSVIALYGGLTAISLITVATARETHRETIA